MIVRTTITTDDGKTTTICTKTTKSHEGVNYTKSATITHTPDGKNTVHYTHYLSSPDLRFTFTYGRLHDLIFNDPPASPEDKKACREVLTDFGEIAELLTPESKSYLEQVPHLSYCTWGEMVKALGDLDPELAAALL